MSILDKFRLDHRRALITGGSRGLGRAMAQAFAEAGADLILVARDADSLTRAKDELAPLGRRIETIQSDVADLGSCDAMCSAALEKHGPIDILVNNVGGRRHNIPTENMSLD